MTTRNPRPPSAPVDRSERDQRATRELARDMTGWAHLGQHMAHLFRAKFGK